MGEPRICRACGAEVVGPETHVCATQPPPRPSAPPSASAPRAGDVLEDRWVLGERISEGGSGTVFRARDRALDVDVAVKILPPGTEPDTVRRLKREIRITRDVDHPNVSRVFDLGTWRDLTFFTMRLVLGESLEDRVKASGPLGAPALVALAKGLVEALAAAHRLGVVHRDVKPSNVLLGGDGTPVLVDFGVAIDTGTTPLARERQGERITPPGAIIGTPAFMAPEQLRGERATPATDLHGLALTISYAATGKLGAPASPEDVFASLGPVLASALVRSLEADAARRPRSAAHVLDDAVRRTRRRAQGWIALVGVIVAVAVVAGIQRFGARVAAPRAGVPVVWIRPLENATGDADLDWLEHGVADLVTAGFETSGRVRIAMDAAARRDAARVEGRIARARGGPALELVLRRADGSVVARDRIPQPTGARLLVEVDDAVRTFLAALGARVPPRGPEAPPPAPVAIDAEAWAHYARGRDLVRRHQDAAALEELRLAITRDPGFALAHLERHVVMSYWTLGSLEESQASLERARENRDRLPPTQRDFLDAIVEAHAARFDRLRAFLRSHPADSATYETGFRIYFAGTAARREYLTEWIARLPEDAEPHNFLGYELETAGDVAGAEREFQEYIRLAPDNPNAYDSYGELLRDHGRTREAIAVYDRGLAIDPTFGASALGAVQAALQLDDLADAERRLERIRGRIPIAGTPYEWYVQAWVALPLLRGDRALARERLATLVADPLVGSRAYLAREYEAIVEGLVGDAGRARAAAVEADRLHKNYHGASRGLASLAPYVDALLASRRRDVAALDRAAAVLGPIVPLSDAMFSPGRLALTQAWALGLRHEPDAAADRLEPVLQSAVYGVGFLASLERARALVAAGRLEDATAAYVQAISRRAQTVWSPEAAVLWPACLREAAALARRTGAVVTAETLEARLGSLR